MLVCTWFWGDKYDPVYVRKLQAGVKRHLTQPYRFIVFSDRPIDGVNTKSINPLYKNLLETKGCFVRLQMFSREWQTANGIERGERIVNIDVDSVITGPLDPLFNRPESFVILQGANCAQSMSVQWCDDDDTGRHKPPSGYLDVVLAGSRKQGTVL